MSVNTFPSLLNFSFFAPTILRITAAVMFIYIGQHLLHNRKKVATVFLPVVGKPSERLVTLGGFATILIAFFLFIGFKTQLAALLGLAGALKFAFYLRGYPQLNPLSTSTNLLLAVLCCTLLLTGAGALAFDLRV